MPLINLHIVLYCQFFHLFCVGKKFESFINQFHFTMEDNIMQNKDHENTVDTTDFSINADENAAGTTHLNEPVENESEVEKLEEELKEQKDKYLRLYAEFDNYRRRTAKENIELRQTAGKEIIASLLDVLDDCDRAEKQMPQANDIDQLKEGVQLIFNKLRSTLQAKGLKAMESINTEFDPEKHEAITEIPAPSKSLKGKVVDEVQKGYYLNDKIIRFAKVVVGK
jgi:molecular chaperone GrpE